MPVVMKCECGKQLKVPDEYVGKRVKCPGCQQVHTVKGQDETEADQATHQEAAQKPAMVRFNCECGKQMQAKAEYAGRTTKCPSCGEPVLIPGGEDEDETAISEKPVKKTRKTVPDDDEEDDEPRSRRRGRDEEDEDEDEDERPRGKKGKKAGRRSMMPWILAVVGVVLLVGVGVGAWLIFGGGSASGDLALIPADAQGFFTVRLADLWKTDPVKELVQMGGKDAAQGLAEVEQKLGIKPDDIERVTFVIRDFQSMQAGKPDMWAIVSSSKPWDTKKIMDALEGKATEKKQKDVTYYVNPAGDGAFYMANPKTLVFAPNENTLKACMAQQEKPKTSGPLERAIKAAGGKAHFFAAASIPKDAVAPMKAMAAKGDPKAADVLDIQTIMISLTISGKDLEMELTGAYPSSDKAKTAKNALNDAKSQAGAALMFVPDQKMREQINKLLGTLTIDQSGSDVVVKAKTSLDLNALGGQGMLQGLMGGIGRVKGATGKVQGMNNLKQIGLAFHDHASANDSALPTSVWVAPNGQQYSWRVQILPYIEEDALYKQILANGAWNSPANQQLAMTKMPKTYEHPSKLAPPGKTYYQGFTGQGMPLGPTTIVAGQRPQPARMPASFPDGTSLTLLIVEGGMPVDWMRPGTDIAFTPQPGGFAPRQLGNLWGDNTFLGVLADGSAKTFKQTMSGKTLQALITPNGAEVLPADWDK
jgi:hypothetical protein